MTTSRERERTVPAQDPAGADRGLDWAVVWFFVIAYALAWGIWGLETLLADNVGMATGDFINAIEDGNFDTITSGTPSWLLYLMTRVQDFSFTIAGLIMISVTAGAAGWRQLWKRLTKWRIPLRWYLLALLPVALYAAAAVIANSSEDGDLAFDSSTVSTILFSLSAGLLVSLFLRGAMGEELGLRGFALPRLQQRTTPSRAALIIGVAWGVWHIPAFLDRDVVTVVVLVMLIIGLSYIFTWLFNGSGGSLIPPLLFHATQNWEEAFETVFPAIIDTDWETPAALALLVLGIVAAIKVTRGGKGARHE
ncbi:MAG: CPBP family intramembrane glutamic endopeptidase [Acidimicrobiales bacterium]